MKISIGYRKSICRVKLKRMETNDMLRFLMSIFEFFSFLDMTTTTTTTTTTTPTTTTTTTTPKPKKQGMLLQYFDDSVPINQ